jgi:hypothetical protein
MSVEVNPIIIRNIKVANSMSILKVPWQSII